MKGKVKVTKPHPNEHELNEKAKARAAGKLTNKEHKLNEEAKARARARGLPDKVDTLRHQKARKANEGRPTTTAGRKAAMAEKYKDKKRPVSSLHSTAHKGEVPLTDEDIASALRKTGGLITKTAVLCNRASEVIRKRLKTVPWLTEVVYECRQQLIDEAEAGLKDLVIAGDREAIKFALRTIGKDRGYKYAEDEINSTSESIEVVIGVSDDSQDKD